MLKKKPLFAILITIFHLVILFSPINKIDAQIKVTSALIKQDTAVTSTSNADSIYIRSDSVYTNPGRQAKSGNLAMLLSAIVPGAGQVYAHRYYTIPLIWGFGAYFSSVAIRANKQYQDNRAKYSESVRLDTALHQGSSEFLRIRDFYHNQRDEFILYCALTYILNIIDAYVGATLYDFDVSNNLGGTAEIRFRIPLH